jgi:hypothetical protein
MLSELDGTVPIDDPHLGHHLGVWRPIPLAWAAAEQPPTLRVLSELKREKPGYFFSDRYRDAWAPALRQLIAARFDAQASDALDPSSSRSTPLVVVKEPGSQVADLLLSLFRGSRMVFLIRDGRDVVDSWLAAHRPGAWAQREGAFAVAPEGRGALVRWLASVWSFRAETVRRAYDAHPEPQRIAIRYESLLRDPAKELARICDRFELATSEGELDRIAADHAYSAVPSVERGRDKAVRFAEPGAWRRHMSPGEQRIMHQAMGEQLVALGYEPAVERRAA